MKPTLWLRIKVWFAWHLWRIAWGIVENNGMAFGLMELKRKMHNQEKWEQMIDGAIMYSENR